jgi:tripeptide aminopeptidase
MNNVVTKEEGGYMDKLLERFLQYVSLDTQSKPGVRQVPSTEGQWKLLRLLQAQLEEMGLVKVTLSEKGTVMGTLPANVEGDIPAIGFISHVDTSRISAVKTLIRRLLKTIAAAISRWVLAMRCSPR